MPLLDNLKKAMEILGSDGTDSEPIPKWSDDDLYKLSERSRDLFPKIPRSDAAALHSVILDMERGPWIAGGAAIQWYRGDSVRKEDLGGAVHDIDIFCAHAAQEAFLRTKIVESGRYVVKHDSKNATTYTFNPPTGFPYKVQLIKGRYFTTVDQLFNNFDIRCAKIATDGKTFRAAPGAIHDINQWICRFDNYRPETVIQRVIKYQTYGYTVDHKFLKGVFTKENVESMELNDPYDVF